MSDDEPDVFSDWETAEEHGHAVGEYLSSIDGEAHRDHPNRNSDGTYRRMNPTRESD